MRLRIKWFLLGIAAGIASTLLVGFIWLSIENAALERHNEELRKVNDAMEVECLEADEVWRASPEYKKWLEQDPRLKELEEEMARHSRKRLEYLRARKAGRDQR